MFSVPSRTKDFVEPSVHTTGIPLSQRFQSVPSHNPLRPNSGGKRVVSALKFEDASSVQLHNDDDGTNSRVSLNPMQRNRLTGVGGGVNKLAVLRASKDAEIHRLRAQVRLLQLKLRTLGHGNAQIGGFKNQRKNRTDNFFIKKRGGGGVVFGQQGKRLNLQSASALSALGMEKIVRIPRSPRKQSIKGSSSSSKNNFFGSPKSKEDLDDELDKYMSKSKSKVKTDLDKELDEYMKVARSQSFAGKVGLIPTTPPTTPPVTVDSDDAEMEIAE